MELSSIRSEEDLLKVVLTQEENATKEYTYQIKKAMDKIKLIVQRFYLENKDKIEEGNLSNKDIQELTDLVSIEIIRIEPIIYKSLQSHLLEIAIIAYYGNSFLTQKSSFLAEKIKKLLPDDIKKYIEKTHGNKNLSSLVSLWNKYTQTKLKETITTNLNSGKTSMATIEKIDSIGKTYKNVTERIYTTEQIKTYSKYQNDAYIEAEKLGIIFEKRWLATLDGKTRDTHRRLDNQIADKNGFFHSGSHKAKGPGLFNVPALDMNCRCTTIAYFQDKMPKVRKENILNKPIIKYTTYKEWEKKI